MVDYSKPPDQVVRASERRGQSQFQSSDPAPLLLEPNAFGGRSPPALIIAQAIRALAWVGILVLFLWLTLEVDLIIFAGVLLVICLPRAADGVSRLPRTPVGLALLLVVLLILAFLSRSGTRRPGFANRVRWRRYR